MLEIEPPVCPDCGHPEATHDPEGWRNDSPVTDCSACPDGVCLWTSHDQPELTN